MARNPLERAFPNLAMAGYTVQSVATPRYNCVAWAVGDTERWWWPVADRVAGVHWPAGAPTALSINGFTTAMAAVGFTSCEHGDIEAGFEKIALYAADGEPTHIARQLLSGSWTSKLGSSVDIEHRTLAALEASAYGTVVAYFRRPRPVS